MTIVGEAAGLDSVSDSVLDAVESVARVLTTTGIQLDEMESRLAVSERKRWTPPAPAWIPDPATRQAERIPAPSRSGRALRDMLSASLNQLSSLEDVPLVEPVRADEDAIVPIESLLYRGAAALERARTLRDELRNTGSTDPDALQELYDLLDLARAE